MKDSKHGVAAALAHREFRLFFIARLLMSMALQIQNLAVAWRVYDLTRDPLALGLVGLAAFLPAILLLLFTGHAADRFDRRRILIASYGVMILTAAGLSLAPSSSPIWPIYALVAALGAARAFAQPAGQALVPSLVPSECLGSAVVLNASVNEFATVGGPAIGGLIYPFGANIAFITAGACFLAAFGLMLLMRARDQVRQKETLNWRSIVAGFRFIWFRPVVLGAISLDLVAVLLGGATALLPIYARDIFGVGPSGLGLLRAMPAIGAIAMAAVLSHRPFERKSGLRLLQAVGLFGLATIGFGLAKSLPVALVFLILTGAADMVSVFVRQTLVQFDTPDAMRGRVSSVSSIFVGASNELGEFESGALAAMIGAVPAVVLGGFGALLAACVWAYFFPALRRRDRLYEKPAATVAP